MILESNLESEFDEFGRNADIVEVWRPKWGNGWCGAKAKKTERSFVVE